MEEDTAGPEDEREARLCCVLSEVCASSQGRPNTPGIKDRKKAKSTLFHAQVTPAGWLCW